MPSAVAIALIGLSMGLALLVALRKGLAASREGKILVFLALFILPVLSIWGGFEEHMDRATSTKFCLSCHVMEDFGQTLRYDDRSYLPARHYQNNSVSRDHACYTCHTDYAMFGGVKAKVRGLRHIYIQYLGTVPAPRDIRLYTPFSNTTCLHCHLGARNFEEASGHLKSGALLTNVKSGQTSCISSGCHDVLHEVGDLKGAKLWSLSK